MKNTLLMFILSVFAIQTAHAQKTSYYSTSHKEQCWWDSESQKYDKCSGGDESSLFTLNPDQTMFHHTTAKISSDYFVTKKEYDSKNDVYTYDVKSDAGNTYFFIVDEKNNQLRIVGNNKTSGNSTYMNVYTIRKTWSE